MKTVGVVAAVALARADVSPWMVAWWVLIVAWMVTTGLFVAQYLQRRIQRRPTPDLSWALTLFTSGVGLLTWGLAAGWTALW